MMVNLAMSPGLVPVYTPSRDNTGSDSCKSQDGDNSDSLSDLEIQSLTDGLDTLLVVPPPKRPSSCTAVMRLRNGSPMGGMGSTTGGAHSRFMHRHSASPYKTFMSAKCSLIVTRSSSGSPSAEVLPARLDRRASNGREPDSDEVPVGLASLSKHSPSPIKNFLEAYSFKKSPNSVPLPVQISDAAPDTSLDRRVASPSPILVLGRTSGSSSPALTFGGVCLSGKISPGIVIVKGGDESSHWKGNKAVGRASNQISAAKNEVEGSHTSSPLVPSGCPPNIVDSLQSSAQGESDVLFGAFDTKLSLLPKFLLGSMDGGQEDGRKGNCRADEYAAAPAGFRSALNQGPAECIGSETYPLSIGEHYANLDQSGTHFPSPKLFEPLPSGGKIQERRSLVEDNSTNIFRGACVPDAPTIPAPTQRPQEGTGQPTQFKESWNCAGASVSSPFTSAFHGSFSLFDTRQVKRTDRRVTGTVPMSPGSPAVAPPDTFGWNGESSYPPMSPSYRLRCPDSPGEAGSPSLMSQQRYMSRNAYGQQLRPFADDQPGFEPGSPSGHIPHQETPRSVMQPNLPGPQGRHMLHCGKNVHDIHQEAFGSGVPSFSGLPLTVQMAGLPGSPNSAASGSAFIQRGGFHPVPHSIKPQSQSLHQPHYMNCGPTNSPIIGSPMQASSPKIVGSSINPTDFSGSPKALFDFRGRGFVQEDIQKAAPPGGDFVPISSRQVPNDSRMARDGLSISLPPSHSNMTYDGVLKGPHVITPRMDRRPDLVESPGTRMKIKDFFKQFRVKEKESFEAAEAYALSCLQLLPEKIHWKIYLEIADMARRENRFAEARKLYKQVNRVQPHTNQGWLDYAKMEEECGRLAKCQKIILRGLLFCPHDEQLMIKGIKHQERMCNLDAARALLSRLHNVSIDKSWRTMLEGASMEARVGNTEVARKIFKYLMKHVPWYGPIYQEACRFEERCECERRALNIVERGLQEIPRYGPLWFSALRLLERRAIRKEGSLSDVRDITERAMQNISKELVWKLYFEASQIEGRADNMDRSRSAFVLAVVHCPPNLRWKVWLGGARTELGFDNIDIARQLLDRAFSEVPVKMRVMVLLELSRLEEYAGNFEKARDVLHKARKETKRGWKVFLESVLLEMRANNIEAAIEEATEALKIHSGTGRLWAVLIQLKQVEGEHEQLKIFQTALREVPKSGEVWCEGARIVMNPLSKHFDLDRARTFLEFAIQFTPQYGDSFVEYLRLEMLSKGPNVLGSNLEQVCVNADPNYGTLWFFCKRDLPLARQVLRVAKALLLEDLHRHRSIYQRAILRSGSRSLPPRPPGSFTGAAPESHLEVGLLEGANTKPEFSKQNQLPRGSPSCTQSDFACGLTALNIVYKRVRQLDNETRRRIIFGSDQIIP